MNEGSLDDFGAQPVKVGYTSLNICHNGRIERIDVPRFKDETVESIAKFVFRRWYNNLHNNKNPDIRKLELRDYETCEPVGIEAITDGATFRLSASLI